MAQGKHGPNRLGSYVEIHHTVMRQFMDRHFVLRDTVRFGAIRNGLIPVYGMIQCEGGIVVTVQKRLSVLATAGIDSLVKTVVYSYHARSGADNLIRYDSADINNLNHRPFSHVHRYPLWTGSPEVVTEYQHDEDDIPTLGELLSDLEVWHYQRAA